MRHSKLFCGLFALCAVTLAATSARAQDQRYPLPFVDRSLTLPSITLSPDVSADATSIVKNPDSATAAPNTCGQTTDTTASQTNLCMSAGFGFGITDDLEIRASIGTLQLSPKFNYLDPRVGATYRFVGAEQFNMGVHLEATVLTLAGAGGVRFEANLPFLVRMGSSARLDMAPGAPVTIQEGKPVTFGLNVPVGLAFQIVEPIHIQARSSVTITDFNDPMKNLIVPLGIVAGISLGSERPIVEIDPYFTWTDFATPGAKEVINIDKWNAGLAARLYLYL